jgi:hypothetical protein
MTAGVKKKSETDHVAPISWEEYERMKEKFQNQTQLFTLNLFPISTRFIERAGADLIRWFNNGRYSARCDDCRFAKTVLLLLFILKEMVKCLSGKIGK